ncbi:MAG: tetratricopeptide repeat protein [Actinomycetota bacterium]
MTAGLACTQPGCGGTILADGYCDTCGFAAPRQPTAPAASSPPGASGPASAAAPVSSSAAPWPAATAGAASFVGVTCLEPGCGGVFLADGYCDTCGIAAPAGASAGSACGSSPNAGAAVPSGPVSASTPPSAPVSMAVPTEPRLSQVVSGSTGSSEARRTAATRRTARSDTGLGMGLVDVEPTPVGDPSLALMSAEKIQKVLDEVPEEERFCRNCDSPVGRGRDGRPGRTEGFCGTCRAPFNFVTNAPALNPGDLVAGQYEILGPLAHGGMGWIYLGRDKAVSDRWVVLKGLLNEDDPDAIASAVAERQFLARIEHGAIVDIYNFVTWAGAGYIVMEFVGGESLNSKLKRLRSEQGDIRARLPVGQAIAYLLEILPALDHLHGKGLVYNDLKPANVMATADGVKLIDVGGVMQLDDDQAAIFGTQGFQAPEVAAAGPSVPSDLYTVGRTLAVLSLPFVFHQGEWLHRIPTPAEQPLLAQWESYHRFLLKATAPHPDDRFQTADDMRDQLIGVLREIVAVSTGTPKPVPSQLFTGDRLADLLVDDREAGEQANWRSLPQPRIVASDPAAGFLLGLPADDPDQAATLLEASVADKQVPWTHEAAFVSAQLAFDRGRDPKPYLDALGTVDPWDWRIRWIEALQALKADNAPQAAELFGQVWTQVPGEIAPRLGVALAAETMGEYDRAIRLYDSVVATDPTFVTASFGLARCRAARKDRQGAVAAYQNVPSSSAGYFDARVAAARTWVSSLDGAEPAADDIISAVRTLEGVQLDAEERADISLEILTQAVNGLEAGRIKPNPDFTLFGRPLTAHGLRQQLETTYRDLARLAPTRAERIRLIDQANAVRKVSIW